jgi:hypothetical protein
MTGRRETLESLLVLLIRDLASCAAQGQPTPLRDDPTAAFSRPPNLAPRTAIITRLGLRLCFAPKQASWSCLLTGFRRIAHKTSVPAAPSPAPCCEIGLHMQKQETLT